jgi:hypothetical protein
MNLLKRKINIPKQGNEQLDTVDMWVVSWESRYGKFSGEVEMNFQSFFDYEDAFKFKRTLEDANKLIGNTSGTKVDIQKKIHGL